MNGSESMTDDSSVRIYRPDGDVRDISFALAPRVDDLAGRRIAVLDNGKPNAVFVMTRMAEHLAERSGARVALVIKKGPGGRTANAAVPCAPDVFDQVVAGADLVITGAADCGSCSAYSVSDTIRLEQSGVPTVLVTTTRFQHVVDTLAANGGMPSIRTLVLEHPIGGTDRVALDHRAAGAVDRVLHLFTGPPASGDSRPVARETTGVDIESLQALVAADGGDLQIDSVDDPEGTVRLSLILPDASCRACVLPGDQLADIAFHRLVGSRPGLRSVVVLDPRDGYLHSGRRP
jgi:hypothetical protein